jgi:hypothetical protein
VLIHDLVRTGGGITNLTVPLNVLVIHKGYDFLGWLKTNAIFTDAKHIKELVARLVEKRPTNPSAES